MRSIPTRMTARFGCRHPFASAGMAFAGGTPDLALAVCAGGGIGAVGAGLTPAEQLRSIIRKVRAGTDAAFNVNLIACLDNDSRIRVCAEEKVPVASFHWGHPSPEHLRLLRDAGVSVWEQVGDVEAAKRAVDDGIEVVVAQGWEAGGHNYRGLTTMVLVPQVLDAVSPALVLAAGGIADGRGVAGALAFGADGVWVGTRLVATTEAAVHPEHIMYRFGEIFADVAVICSQKTASRKGFAAVSLASRSSRLRITAKCSLLSRCYSLLLDHLERDPVRPKRNRRG